MILAMRSHGRSTSTTRRLGVMTAAAACAALVAGLGAGAASAKPGDDITEQCLEMSFDGTSWLDLDGFVSVVDDHYTDYIPVPSDEGTALEFDVRNTCDVPAQFTIYSQNWIVEDENTATVRGAIDGQEGQQYVIGPGEDASERIFLKEKALQEGVAAGVAYILGIPEGETTQKYKITPGWGFVLEEAAVAPEAPTGLTASEIEVEVGAEVSIGGSAEPGSEVTISGGGQTCETVAAEDGSFECSLTFTESGDKSITATAGNDAGTSGPSDAVVVTVVDDDDDGEQGGSGSLGSSSGSLGSLDLFGSLGLK